MKKDTKYGKGFAKPFSEQDYYAKYSIEQVLERVLADIEDHFYLHTFPAHMFKDDAPDNLDLTMALKMYIPVCPDLFESDNPVARKMVKHFGELIQRAHYGKTPKERSLARNTIDDMLGRGADAKWKNIYIPSDFSLVEMYEYMLKIAKNMKSRYQSHNGSDLITNLDLKDESFDKSYPDIDSRIIPVIQLGKLKQLLDIPSEYTKEVISDFFNIKAAYLNKLLKLERALIRKST